MVKRFLHKLTLIKEAFDEPSLYRTKSTLRCLVDEMCWK